MNSEQTKPTILVVEDDPTSRMVHEAALAKIDAQITSVPDGKVAVDRVLKAEQVGEPFDVLIMDIRMPGLSGLSATRALREKGFSGGIIAVTAFSRREECIEAGCDDFLAKPCSADQLREKVSAVLRRQHA